MKPAQEKYIPFVPLKMEKRAWPDKQLMAPPIWCSVDLRDGNQALIDPMNVEEKLELFHTLVDIGVKEIEVGFPSASETEYEFLRTLIDWNHIPDYVTIQVLVQAREHLIRKTFEAIDGARHVIFHFYNSTSTLQRKVVFHTDVEGVKKIAVDAAHLIRELSQPAIDAGMDLRYEYSPESFMGTEMDAAVEICQAVIEALHATPEHKVILNLPPRWRTACPTTSPTRSSTSSPSCPAGRAPSSPCTPTTTVARAWPPPSWANWPERSGWRPPCSATASAPATWTW